MKVQSTAVKEHLAGKGMKRLTVGSDDDDKSSILEETDTVSKPSESNRSETAERRISNNREAQAVRNIKFIGIAVLFVSIAGAIVIHFYVKNSEQNRFIDSFDDDANKVRIRLFSLSSFLRRIRLVSYSRF
jgi:hypothetical protein